MNQERITVLHQVVCRWKVDVESGEVVTRSGVAKSVTSDGYYQLCTTFQGKKYKFSVHEIIAFVGGLDILNKTINHVSGDKKDNRLSNLEAVSSSENTAHAHRTGLIKYKAINKGSSNNKAVLCEDSVREIKKLISAGKLLLKDIADLFNVSPITISHIKAGRTWSHIEEEK